jgi:cytochrome c-type biogenesis protein CcmH/NrfG
MRIVEAAVLWWVLLFAGLGLGVSQAKASREQQVQAHSQRATEYLRKNQPDLAMPELRAILTIDPNNVDAHGNLGAVLFFQGSYQDSIPQLRAAEMLSTLATPEGNREAESEYKAALQANPRDAQAEARLGEIALRANDVQKAAQHYRRAVRLRPNDGEAAVGLARVLMSQNQLAKAEALLQHALQLDPTNSTARYRLSTIYRQTGRTVEAKQELEEYQKYRKMKEKLREVYRGLRGDRGKEENEEPGPSN